MARHEAKVVEPDAAADWLTGGEAAALTGLSLSMVEWWAASSKIKTRPRQEGPTINRESLLAYVGDWKAAKTKPRPPRPPNRPRPPVEPPGEEWIGVSGAAALLNRKPEFVTRIARQAGITIQRSHGRVWLRRDEVQALAAERNSWISWVDASALTGFTPSVIGRAVGAGRIEQRPEANRAQPGLSRKSVVAWAEGERARLAEVEARRQAERQRGEPPNGRHQWMRVPSAAKVLGVHPTRVRQLIDEDRLPATRKDGKVWLRLDHVERARAAREATRTRQP